ncbi:hypothetical protein [Nostoc flagelliforme]|uniref:hypothetical protein n=1 Tax=Nostoc flagelliforme TaxID=1306274 RepID=UPI000C2D5ABB|nr:hypothetical protein [Nostoc flagelliforme]
MKYEWKLYTLAASLGHAVIALQSFSRGGSWHIGILDYQLTLTGLATSPVYLLFWLTGSIGWLIFFKGLSEHKLY